MHIRCKVSARMASRLVTTVAQIHTPAQHQRKSTNKYQPWLLRLEVSGSISSFACTSRTLARHDIVYKRPDIDICRYRHQDSTISCLRFWATISGTILSYDIEVSVFDIEYSKLRYRITQKWKNADIVCFIFDIEACQYRINLRYRMFLAATISKNLRYRH